MRYKAKRLLYAIRQIPDLEWNDRGELVYHQSVVPQSNIVALFNDILKIKQPIRAVGWEEFAEGLASSNDVVRDLVPNHSSWKHMNRNVPSERAERKKSRRELRREEKTPVRKKKTRSSPNESWVEF